MAAWILNTVLNQLHQRGEAQMLLAARATQTRLLDWSHERLTLACAAAAQPEVRDFARQPTSQTALVAEAMSPFTLPKPTALADGWHVAHLGGGSLGSLDLSDLAPPSAALMRGEPEFQFTRPAGEPLWIAACPVRDPLGFRTVGIVRLGGNVNFIQSRLIHMRDTGGMDLDVWVFDQNGQIIAMPPGAAAPPSDAARQALLSHPAAKRQPLPAGAFSPSAAQAVWVGLPEYALSIVAVQDNASFYRPLTGLIVLLLLSGLAVTAAAALVSVYLARASAHRLSGLTAAAEQMAAGDPTAAFDAAPPLEFTALANALNTLYTRLDAAARALQTQLQREKGAHSRTRERLTQETAQRKKAEEALRVQQQLFNLGPVMILRRPAVGGRYALLATDNLRQLGHSAEDFRQGKISLSRLIHPEDRPLVEARIREYDWSSPTPLEQDYRVALPSGEVRWLHDTTYLRPDASGKTLVYDSYLLDVTRQKLAERLVAENEALFRTLIHQIPDFLQVWDLQTHRSLFCNRGEFLGRAAESFFAREQWIHFVHPQDQTRVQHAWQSAHQEYQAAVEFRLQRQDHSYAWYEMRLRPLLTPHSSAAQYLLILLSEIDTRKMIELQLRQSETKLRGLIEQSEDGILLADSDGSILEWNRGQERLTGVRREDALGRKTWEMTAALWPAREKTTSILRSLKDQTLLTYEKLRQTDQSQQSELTLRTPEGGQRVLQTLTFPIHLDSRIIFGAVTRDISEFKQAQLKSQEYARELEELNEEARQFVYIISHDLRAPLVNLKGYSAEIRHALERLHDLSHTVLPALEEKHARELQTQLTTNLPEALEFIDSSVIRMDHYINALLKLSREGRRELKFERVDMNALMASTLETLSHQLTSRGVKVHVGQLPTLTADRTALEQVFGNLINNAVIYLDPKRPGELEIRAEHTPEGFLFQVRDNGRGISAEDLPLVFLPFRRGKASDVPGEGLGLAVVQALVRRHSGRIWVESTPDKGTTFFINIPAHL